MGFTTVAFIRRNTPELRKKLEELGYKPSRVILDGEKLCLATAVNNDYAKYTNITNEMFDSTNPHETWNCAGRIDCGINEDLFLAIAALRDDTSANQYWVFDHDFPPHYQKGDFTIGHFHRCSCYCHVASVEELIEHFKGKEEK